MSLVVKDRTKEFSVITEGLRKRGVRPNLPLVKTSTKKTSIPNDVQVNQIASEIGRETYETAQKLKELTKLAKSRSLFDDPAEKIQELTFIIKGDIQRLNNKISNLQQYIKSKTSSNPQSSVHQTTIVDSLKNNLLQTTNQFREVLEIRTDNLKSQQERKESVIGTKRSQTQRVFQPQTYSTLYNDDEQNESSELTIDLPIVQTTESILESRTNAIRVIESTMEELKVIFQNLATLVSQQAETIQRIDENVEYTMTSVEGADKHLLSYLTKISSNRWLIVKIFIVLIVFAVLFLVFFA
eukprot:TRINITY_DN11149_c0_g1_i1.p1 TRINITY_DN11149_c0_g1~~TRINITY_DN11149_c0_g1_i1.p1  ORF type:complete len:298 (-),score=36.24 TRINITY_DN11149_c0_g1_i1:21-914(-)